MKPYDWSKFTERININADIKKIYSILNTQAGLEYWFLRKAEFTMPDKKLRDKNSSIQPGDAYLWMWHGHPDTTAEKGKVLEVNGVDTIKFTFAGECIVTISVKTEEGKNIVELTHENIPLDEDSKAGIHVGCSTGWAFYLVNLKSLLEGGIDLRNRDEKIKRVINA
jgi:hypothetical protein